MEVIKAIMVKYAHKSEDEAESLILSSFLVNDALEDYIGIVVRCHEYHYHWAMVLVYVF